MKMSNFFLSCKRKAGLVIKYDYNYCQIILLDSLSRLESYKLVASSGGTSDVLVEYLFWNLGTSTFGNLLWKASISRKNNYFLLFFINMFKVSSANPV